MFKRIVCMFCVIVCLGFFWSQNSKPLFYDFSDEFEIYLVSSSSTAVMVKTDCVDYGFYTDIKGESCRVNVDNVTVEDILKKFDARVVFTETTEECVNYYAYSDNIKYRKTLNGKIINLHVSLSDSSITIGSPMIFGSF